MARRRLGGRPAWRGEAMADSDAWVHPLSREDLADLEDALAAARVQGLGCSEISKDAFPLPVLGPRLARIGREMEEGCGIAKLTGLQVDAYEDGDLRRLWCGIASHLGIPVHQDSRGLLMRAIRNEGPDIATRHGAIEVEGETSPFLSSKARTLSSGPLRFHTDRCDVVGLLCVRAAKSGGNSRIASSVAVHDEMLERRPDLVELLYEPYYRSRFGEEEGGEKLSYALPVFAVRDGRFASHYSRTYIEAAQLMRGVPKMSAAQWEALDMLHDVAEELCFEMRLEPGDMQFLNNHVVYHARGAFEDDPRPERGRLLYRLWLCVPNHRALPVGHEVLWRNVEAGELRGGIGLGEHMPASTSARMERQWQRARGAGGRGVVTSV